jgi:phosphoglycolate phosphatase-like HAD superfamily hydrolase
MSNSQSALSKFQKNHDFLVCFDSDGSVFDTAEFKTKECFIPGIIRYWDLQPIARYARTAAEYVNLYSRWRGANRFVAIVALFDMLEDWPELKKRGAKIPEAKELREWVARESVLSNSTLRAELERTGSPVLKRALEWSEAANREIVGMMRNVPPYPLVREIHQAASSWADVLVCSTTIVETLTREWTEHGLDIYPQMIAGQEMGNKREHIGLAAAGRYASGRILMVGDAPGDRAAARANGASFFPIVPGEEEASWRLFLDESLEKFHQGEYTAEYEARLNAEFDKRLHELPPWRR